MNVLFAQYPHLAARLFDVPLLIHPAKLDAILHGLSQRLGVAYPEPHAYLPLTARKDGEAYRVNNGVALIDVFGILAHRSGGMNPDSSAIQSYEAVADQLRSALSDPAVSSILMQLDSPGGEVSGAFQLAEQIYQGRSIKPIHALANDLAASAAYLIGSAATTLTVSPTGQVGSIGVVMRHIDVSQAMEKEGVKVTFIHAGAHKVDGNPYEPLPEAVKARLQADVDHYYNLFVNAVAKHRNLDPHQIRATEAGMFVAEEALRIGLVDMIEQPHDWINRSISGFITSSVNMKESSVDKPELKAEEGLNSVVYDALADLADERGQLISQLENRVEELEASLLKETEQAKTFFDRMTKFEAELLDLKRAEREKAVIELFADLNREVTPEAMSPYLNMSADLFAVVAEDMRSLKPKSFSENLFREIATGSMKESATEASLAAQLYNQVAGIK
jgi:signal peptide peptidase SppA